MAADGLLFSKFFCSDLHMDSAPHSESKKEPTEVAAVEEGHGSSDTDQIVQESIAKVNESSGSESGVEEVANVSTDARVQTSSSYVGVDHSTSISDTSMPTRCLEPNQRNEDSVTPMLIDPNLPAGWTRKVTQRTMGASAGKYDVYIFSPDGKKFRSRTDLMLYLIKNKMDLDPNDIDFSVRGRANTLLKRPSSPRATRPKKAKLETSKLATDSKALPVLRPNKSKRSSKGSSGAASAVSTAQFTNSSTCPTSKLIVKFNFPIARVKRSASLKIKKNYKKKVMRQDSQTSQVSDTHNSHSSDNSHTSGQVAAFECHEELSNGEARLTDSLYFGDDEGII